MAVDDLVDVLGRDAAVPDAVGIDHHRAAVLAVVETARLVGAHAVCEAACLEGGLECLVELLAPFLRARAPRMPRTAIVEAYEQVPGEGRTHCSSASAARKAAAGSAFSAIAGSKRASTLPRRREGVPSTARSVSRRGAWAASASASVAKASAGAFAATARSMSSRELHRTQASMCVARADPHRRASKSPGSSAAWRST